jgi:hypothetical protein
MRHKRKRLKEYSKEWVILNYPRLRDDWLERSGVLLTEKQMINAFEKGFTHVFTNFQIALIAGRNVWLWKLHTGFISIKTKNKDSKDAENGRNSKKAYRSFRE